MDIIVKKSKISGTVNAPPSKSYAHRYIIASFLSGENTIIHGVGESRDVYATLNALSKIGLDYTLENGNVYIKRKAIDKNPVLDCYESGSTIRFLIPVVSALGVECEFTGSARLLSRPLGAIIDSLNSNGADIEGLKLNGKLQSGHFFIDGTISSQFITGLLFALPLLDGDSHIKILGETVSRDYINITLDVLDKFGIIIEKTFDGYFVKGNQQYVCPKEIVVEGDFSGSAFLLCQGAIGGSVTVKNLNLNSCQGDKMIVDALKMFGAKISVDNDCITVENDRLTGITMDMEDIPDIVQILSVVASFAKGKSVFKNVSRLVIKESDRLQGIINNLGNAGIKAEYNNKDLTVYGGLPHGSVFEGENDHRTVMSAVTLALFSDGESKIIGAEAINKSYPSFFDDVKKLGGNISGDI